MAELQGPPTVGRTFWGVVVEPGVPYVHKPSPQGGHVWIREATLGNTDALSLASLEYKIGDAVPIRLCTLNSSRNISSYHLDLYYDMKQDVTFSVSGNCSIHLWGYYNHPHAEHNPVGNAANLSCMKTWHRGGSSDDSKNDVDHSSYDNKTIDVEDEDEEVVDTSFARATKRPEDSLVSGHTKLKRVQSESNVDESFGSDFLRKESRASARSGRVRSRETKDHELIIKDLEVGSHDGKKASNGSKVTVKFVGELMGGKIVDPLGKHEFDLGAGLVIRGWDLGIIGMRVGGKRKLIIPPSLAFGDAAGLDGKVPPNSWLVYQIELIKVKGRHDEGDRFSVNL